MKKVVLRETAFFALIFTLFFLAVKLRDYLMQSGPGLGLNIHRDVAIVMIGVVYTMIIVAIFFLAKLNPDNNENFWEVSQGARCRGGPYFWQGDSENAQMCREMAESPMGRVEISSYNCPSGFNGIPSLPFYYTPLSNDNYQNERCNDAPTCPFQDVGLCSMQAQV